MIGRERLDQLSKPVVEIYNAIQAEMLINIAKRLNAENIEDVEVWQLDALDQLNSLTEENINLITRTLGKTQKEVDGFLEEAGLEGVEENEKTLQRAVADGVKLTVPLAPKESNMIIEILAAYQKQARNVFNLVNSTMLIEVEQAYRDVINRTAAEVLTGTKTLQQALRNTVREWSNKGIPALRDKNGREWSAEGYVRMVTRTMSTQVTREMQEARFDEWGVDLVEISSHSGARPKCAKDQGKIYSRSGKSKVYPPLASTSIGQPDGLFGINCRHHEYPYFHGSTKRFNPYPKEENEQAYKNSQIQRRLERNIRNAKTEKRMLEAVGDTEGVKIADERIREGQAKMRAFINETGRTRRYGREQIY